MRSYLPAVLLCGFEYMGCYGFDSLTLIAIVAFNLGFISALMDSLQRRGIGKTPLHPPHTPDNFLLSVHPSRPPALHFYAKRRAADPDTVSASALRRNSATAVVLDPATLSTLRTVNPADEGVDGEIDVGSRGDSGAVGVVRGVSTDTLGAAEDERDVRREELDQVVYYYDVATIWIRPVDVKVKAQRCCDVLRTF